MRKFIARAVAAAVFAVAALGADAAGVGIVLDPPRSSLKKTHSGDSKSGNRRNRKMTESYRSSNSYSGRVRCVVQKKETMEFTLEAFFITRDLSGKKSGPEKIDKTQNIGSFRFVPDAPTAQSFSFSAPEYVYEEHTVQTGNRRRIHVERTTTGKRYVGVVVRAVSGASVLCVKSSPYNYNWEAAAKKPNFTLDADK